MPLESGFAVSIRDGKRKVRNVFVRADVADTVTLTALDAYTLGVAQRISELVEGEIISATYKRDRDVSILTNNVLNPDSDVEEGAIFLSESAEGFKTSLRLPTFSELYLVAGTRLVDFSQGDVADFVGLLENTVVGFATDVTFQTISGAALTNVYEAYEQFKASKGKPS